MHHYKFIVDGEWRFSPDDTTAPDEHGNINNIIDTTNYEKSNQILPYNDSSSNTHSNRNSNLIISPQSSMKSNNHKPPSEKNSALIKETSNRDFAETAPMVPPHLLRIHFLMVYHFLIYDFFFI